MPLSQIVSASIEDGAVAPVDLSANAQFYNYKNKIINGAFQVWQRATTYALTGGFNYGSADRWAFAMAAPAAGIANQVASGLTGFQYALKLGRNSGSTATGYIYANQVVENANTYDLQGQTATFSFYAKAGANYSAASNLIGLTINTGTGTDATTLSGNFGGWTGNAQPFVGGFNLTTSWVRYSATFAVGSTVTNIGALFSILPTGTAGADDNVYITGVQLEKGSVATTFDIRPYTTELQLCQRYLPAFDATGTSQYYTGQCAGASLCYAAFPFPVTARAIPTGVSLSAAASAYGVTNAPAGQLACTGVTFNSAGYNAGLLNISVASGLVAGNATLFNVYGNKIFFTGCEL